MAADLFKHSLVVHVVDAVRKELRVVLLESREDVVLLLLNSSFRWRTDTALDGEEDTEE